MVPNSTIGIEREWSELYKILNSEYRFRGLPPKCDNIVLKLLSFFNGRALKEEKTLFQENNVAARNYWWYSFFYFPQSTRMMIFTPIQLTSQQTILHITLSSLSSPLLSSSSPSSFSLSCAWSEERIREGKTKKFV